MPYEGVLRLRPGIRAVTEDQVAQFEEHWAKRVVHLVTESPSDEVTECYARYDCDLSDEVTECPCSGCCMNAVFGERYEGCRGLDGAQYLRDEVVESPSDEVTEGCGRCFDCCTGHPDECPVTQ